MWEDYLPAGISVERSDIMTEREMFEKSFQRPSNYFKLSSETQWRIDGELGILDWVGDDLTDEDMERFKKHYDKVKEPITMKTTLEDSIVNAVEECQQMGDALTKKTYQLGKHLELRAVLDDPKSMIRKRLSEIEWKEEEAAHLARLNCYRRKDSPQSHVANIVIKATKQVSFHDNQVELWADREELILQFANVKIKAKLIDTLNLKLKEKYVTTWG